MQIQGHSYILVLSFAEGRFVHKFRGVRPSGGRHRIRQWLVVAIRSVWQRPV